MNMQLHFHFIALAGAAFVLAPGRTFAQERHMHNAPTGQIPASIRAEHEEIIASLSEATKVPGPIGIAAKALADVLYPHFVREEQIALPPLGLLAPLARGEMPQHAASIATLSDSLRIELPRMLEEHKTIRAAVHELGRIARDSGAEKYVQFAAQLAHHALTEEEVLYPAAVVVGDLIRARAVGSRKENMAAEMARR